MDLLSTDKESWKENEEKCQELLQNFDWDKIPSINTNNADLIKENTLVRFRGMVQDMYGPEFYVDKFIVKNVESGAETAKHGKYLDSIQCSENEVINLESPNTETKERQTFVIITTPGENQWVKDYHDSKNEVIHPQKQEKPSEKRPLEDEDMDVDSTLVSENSETTQTKKQCGETDAKKEPDVVVSAEHILNFPLEDIKGKACHVKIYNNFESLKLNEVCEFVGFLSANPNLSQSSNHVDDDNQMEVQTHHPPASLVPRIHCVAFRKVDNANPLIVTGDVMNVDKINYVRKELHILFTQLLCGDDLAAEYLIFHLISHVYNRCEMLALGKFSLNISNVPIIENIDFPKEFYNFLELILPKSHYFPMTLENMNTLEFTPKKDYESNRLTSGILQLSSNTHLIVDETKLSSGKLNEAGIKAVQAMAGTIKNQKIMYDFNFYPLEFECDIPFLVLSEGKSLLPSDCHIVLKPDSICLNTYKEILEAGRHFLKPELLNDVRIFLSTLRAAKYEITDNVHELVQNEFIKMRQNKKATGEDLHTLLVLARLVSISCGKNTLDEESWRKACELEENRKSRIVEKK